MEFAILSEPNAITTYLLGKSNINYLNRFRNYIEDKTRQEKVQMVTLHDEETLLGIFTAFGKGRVFFFGNFWLLDNSEKASTMLIKKMKELAFDSGRDTIIGPIDIPVILLGYGFQIQGNDYPFIGCPSNPVSIPRYFIEQGFSVKSTILRYRCPIWQESTPLPREKERTFSDLVFTTLDDITEITPFKTEISRNFEVYALIFDDLISVLTEFDCLDYLFAVKHQPSGKIIAAGHILPNPFDITSISMQNWQVVDSFRRKGVTEFMWEEMKARLESHVTWGLWPVDSNNLISKTMALKRGGVLDRKHIILVCGSIHF